MIGPRILNITTIEYETCPRTIFNKWGNTVDSDGYADPLWHAFSWASPVSFPIRSPNVGDEMNEF